LPIPAAEQRGITANFPAERPLVIMVLTQQSCGEFTLNPRYNAVLPLNNGIDYLGYIIYPHYRLVRKRVIDNLKSKLNYFASKLYLQTAKDVIEVNYDYPLLKSLHATLASYLGHLQHANSYRLLESLFKRFSWLKYFFKLAWQSDKAYLERRYCFKTVDGGVSQPVWLLY